MPYKDKERDRKMRYYINHSEEKKAWMRDYRKRRKDAGNPLTRRPLTDDEKKEKKRKELLRQRSRRLLVIEHYGGKCACCGETQVEFLCFDHINGGGNAHRRQIHNSQLPSWLISHNFPEGFQVLCHNCNCSKGFYGYCPHHPDQKI